MTELRNLKNKVHNLKLSILKLDTERKQTITEIIEKTNEFDREYLVKYHNELSEKYINYHPNLFNQIIVSCFNLITVNFKYGSGSHNRIFLSDLLKLWNNGFIYENNPIINIENNPYSNTSIITYIENGEIKSVATDIAGYKKIHDLFFEILGKDYKVSNKYSKTSLSDLTFDFDKNV